MRMRYWFVFLVLLGTFPSMSDAGVMVLNEHAVAPNLGFSTPSKLPWMDGVVNYYIAKYNGVSPSVPAQDTPATFWPVGSEIRASLLVRSDDTSFGWKSWDAKANPTGVYAEERGGALNGTFVVAGTNGELVKASNIAQQSGTSDGRFNTSLTVTPSAVNYNTFLIGILFGQNGVPGGGDDTIIKSGSGSQAVNMIIGAGRGLSANADVFETFGRPDQERLDIALNNFSGDGNFDYRTDVKYMSDAGAVMASALDITTITSVPEPTTLTFLGFAALGLARRRRR